MACSLLSADEAVLTVGKESAIDRGLILEILDLDVESAEKLDGGETLSGEKLAKVLSMFALVRSRMPYSFLARAAADSLPPVMRELAESPDRFRGTILPLQGMAVRVERFELTTEERSRFGCADLYKVYVRLATGEASCVYVTAIPKAWRVSGEISEPFRAYGIFLFRERTGPGETGFIPAFLASRIEWYPDTLLGRIGVDVGSLDAVPTQPLGLIKTIKDKERLKERIDFSALRWSSADTEPFYQILASCSKTPPYELDQIALEKLKESGLERSPVVDIFNNPEKMQGELLILYGNAKQISRIMVENEEIRKRFGISWYYEIALYTGDSEGNPIFVCVTHLPEGMPIGSENNYNEEITVAGFFYKNWAYRIAPEGRFKYPLSDMDLESHSQWKFAPVLIGRGITWHAGNSAAEEPRWHPGATLVIPVMILLFGCWFLLRLRRPPEKPIEFKFDLKPPAEKPKEEPAQTEFPEIDTK